MPLDKTKSFKVNVAPDQAIILGLQIFLDHRSLSSIGQKILMILHQNSVNIVNDVKTVFVVIPDGIFYFKPRNVLLLEGKRFRYNKKQTC